MIADEAAELALQKAVDRASRCHRPRFAVDQFVAQAVLGLPAQESR